MSQHSLYHRGVSAIEEVFYSKTATDQEKEIPCTSNLQLLSVSDSLSVFDPHTQHHVQPYSTLALASVMCT